MIILAMLASLATIGLLCWLLFTLAVFALPAFVAVTAGVWAHGTGAGIPGALLVGAVAAVITLAASHLLISFVRPMWLKLIVAATFVAPAVIAGFHATHGIVILCAGEEIARHHRSYATGAFVFDPLHYLMLIEMKPNALDQAAPLQGWALPEPFQHLRHLLEARMGNRGKREFIQVLRLLEACPMATVTEAVTEAIRLGAIGFDAVKQIALARSERRPLRLDLARYRKRSADNVRPKVPRHEHFDFGCRPALSDAGQGLREPVERIDAVHFAGLQQGGYRRPGSSTAVAAGE